VPAKTVEQLMSGFLLANDNELMGNEFLKKISQQRNSKDTTASASAGILRKKSAVFQISVEI
jgi:hypothetical protein